MATAPTFIASYNSVYNTSTSPKTVSVTTQAGDVVVVYGGMDTGISASLSTPSGNGITFTLIQSNAGTFTTAAYVWTGVDSVGGTSWTLSESLATGSAQWGFGCAVFRGSAGIGVSNNGGGSTGTPSFSLSTSDNSAVLFFGGDSIPNGGSLAWLTINSITPSSGNGLELVNVSSSGVWRAYAAYWNDTGTAGSKTVGMSSPTGQNYGAVAVEILGTGGGGGGSNTVTSAWLRL